MSDNNKNSNSSKAEKTGTILLPVGFLREPRIIELENRHGLDGLMTYLKTLEVLMIGGGQTWESTVKKLAKTEEEGSRILETFLELDLMYKTGKFLRSHHSDQDINSLTKKRKRWRKGSAKYRETHNTVSADPEGADLELQNYRTTELRTIESRNKNLESRSGSSTDPDPVYTAKYGEFVFLKPADYDSLLATHGEVFLKRCIEKLDNWIAQDPTPSKIKAGKNAINSFRNWVITAIAQEQASAQRLEASGGGNGWVPKNVLVQQRNLALLKKITEEEERKKHGKN